MILVDTSVWSLTLRRKRRDLSRAELAIAHAVQEMIISGEAAIIGPVRQEILSGISAPGDFETLRDRLDGLMDLPLPPEVYVMAASYFNACRAKGIAPDAIDMTICAAAAFHGAAILTTDPDFTRYAQHLPIQLHQV